MTAAQALYRLFNAEGELLYVGISLNPTARWGQHRDGKPWWTEVTLATIETFDSRAEVHAAEVAAIKAESPRYNRNHHPANGPSRVHRVRVPQDLWDEVKGRAKERGQTVSQIARMTLETYTTDPQAFNAACATIRGRR